MIPVERLLPRLQNARRSSNGWLACCPAHHDQTPSLSIAEGDDGRVLLRCHAGCSVEAICAAVGVVPADLFPERSSSTSLAPDRSKSRGGRSTADRTIDLAAAFKTQRDKLNDDRMAALAYETGVPASAWMKIGLGWCTAADLRAMRAGGADWQDDYPDAAWCFAEYDGDTRLIGLSLRASDGRKGAPSGTRRGLILPTDLFSLPDPVLIVEGASDVAACCALGLTSVGRPSNRSGAADLAILLQDRDLIVVGENDANGEERCPGREGAIAVAKKLATAWDLSVRWTLPPSASKDVRDWFKIHVVDPGDRDACEAAGRELLETLISTAEEAQPDHAADLSINADHVPGRVKSRVTISIGEKLVAVEDINLSSRPAREKLSNDIAEKTDISLGVVESRLLECAAAPVPPKGTKAAPTSRDELLAAHDDQVARELEAMPVAVIEEAERMLADPQLVDRVLIDIAALGLVGEQELALTLYVVGASRLLDRPLASSVQGTTSSGKSYTIECVARLFPDESKLIATDLTPNALYYLNSGRLMHRFVVAGERARGRDDERAEAKRALREMISAGELTKVVTMNIGGRLQTVIIYQPGPVSFVESTTQTRLFDEDANRMLLLSTDESPEQTRRVVNAAAARAQRSGSEGVAVVARHHAMHRLLRRVKVVVPYAEKIASCLPTERPEARRAIGHIIDCVRAVALLHQRQRTDDELEHGDTIEARLDDYIIARRLLSGPLARSLGSAVPEAAARLAQRLEERYGRIDIFTTTDAAKDDAIICNRGKMGGYLATLRDAGVVEQVEPGRGRIPSTWRIVAEVPDAVARWLPTLDDLAPNQERVLCKTV